jgi:hypothetical protein
MINISPNLFNADILEVFADGEQIGTIKIVRELEEYEAKPKDGQPVTLRTLNLCKNYFQNLCKGRERKTETNSEPQNQLNLF